MIGVKWDAIYLRVGTNKRVLQPSLRRVAGLRDGIFRTNVFGIGSADIEEAFSSGCAGKSRIGGGQSIVWLKARYSSRGLHVQNTPAYAI